MDSLEKLSKDMYGNGNPQAGVIWRITKLEGDMNHPTRGVMVLVEKHDDIVQSFQVGVKILKVAAGFLGLTSLASVLALLKVFGLF